MGKKSDPPAPPDPYKTAEAQTGANVSTAIANNAMAQINQVTPDGSLSYSQTGTYRWTDPTSGKSYTLPQYTATTTLSPEAQALRDANNRGQLTLANLGADQAARAGDLLSRPMDTSSLPPAANRAGETTALYGANLTAPTYDEVSGAPDYTRYGEGPNYTRQSGNANLLDSYDNEFTTDRSRVEQALFERMNPQLDRSRQQLETSLANRGIKLGSAAYDRALDESNRAATDARYGAILNAGAEQDRLQNQARASAEFTNNARQTGYTNSANQVGYNNSLTAQERADQLATTASNNDLITQELANRTNVAGFNNAARGQGFADQQAIQARSDANTTQQWNQRQALLDALDNSRSRTMQEQFALRNQPINEITALLSGSQVATPQFGIAQSAQMPTTDIAGLINQRYSQDQQNYQTQMSQQQAAAGGLFGLGATLIGPGGWLGKTAKA